MTLLHSPNQNHLLAALPATEFERLAPHLQLVPMPLGEILYESSAKQNHAYFPTTAIVSLHYVTETGASSEIAGVGLEGVVGVSLFMGGNSTPSAAVVQTAGHAYRLERSVLKQEFEQSGVLQSLLLRYTQALMTQELVAGMLGVRREGVTEAAGKLQLAGYIRYRRGHISVLDRTGLESRACECYGVVNKEFTRLLSDVRHRQSQVPV